ncbi:MAG: hypothetical protein CM15mP74_23960 [Halieaceae bacterium]|nr:MAG: hypothetical protein CM15mP74_23960 [Halieaceae bacterium]
MSRQFFGTDGIRGEVGKYPVTADFMLKLGWAAGRVFASAEGQTHVLIGKDTRVSGYMFESALEAGLVAAGARVTLLGPMPTPAVAMLTRSQKASAGIVISASHNAYTDNGIKFFDAEGRKLSDDLEVEIERMLSEPMDTVPSAQLGKAARMVDAPGRYVEFCKNTFPEALSLRGLRLVLDCAHGATYQVAPQVFTELGATVGGGCRPEAPTSTATPGPPGPERGGRRISDGTARHRVPAPRGPLMGWLLFIPKIVAGGGPQRGGGAYLNWATGLAKRDKMWGKGGRPYC